METNALFDYVLLDALENRGKIELSENIER